MACNGNATENCGGSNRLNVYQSGNVNPSTPTSTTTTTTPNAPTGLPAGWSYIGCHIDNANGRILINAQPGDPQLTVGKCASACVTAGYTVAGMEFGTGT